MCTPGRGAVQQARMSVHQRNGMNICNVLVHPCARAGQRTTVGNQSCTAGLVGKTSLQAGSALSKAMADMTGSRLVTSEERIRVLETLLQRTYAAHPQLKEWALQSDGIALAGGNLLSALPRKMAIKSSEQSQKLARLRQNRDKWRDRAYRLKQMCKQLHLQVQQGTTPARWTSSDAFPDHTTNLFPAGDVGILHSNTQLLSNQELQELRDELVATAPATRAYRQGSSNAPQDSVPIMTLPGLHRIRVSTEGHAGANASPVRQVSAESDDFPPAMPHSATYCTPTSAKACYKSALKKRTEGSPIRKKGVSLHESQNITHEFEDEAALERKHERVPSIMDMLLSGGAPPDQPEQPSLLDVLQPQEREQRQAERQGQQRPRRDSHVQQQGVGQLLPCMLAVKTSLDTDGNTQVSLSIDDATRDVLTGLLKMASTDKLNSTPPLDFFAAAGLLESFTYTPTDPKTPAYFKVNKVPWQSDEQSNPFARTGRIAIAHQDDDDDDASASCLQSGDACDSCAPCEVVGFACYDDSPRAPGSAMDMVQLGQADSGVDIADHIFGPAASGAQRTSEDDRSDLLDRMFASSGGGSDDGYEAAREAVLVHIFGGSAEEEGVSEEGSEAMMDGTADRIFGTSVQGDGGGSDATVSPTVKDRVMSFEEMFGSRDWAKDHAGGQGGGERRPAVPSFPDQRMGEHNDLHIARAALTQRIFGDVESAPRYTEGVDGGYGSGDERAALTHRIFGRDMEGARADMAGMEAEDEDVSARLALTDCMFGRQVEATDGVGDHHAELEQRIFGDAFLAKAAGEQLPALGVKGGAQIAGINKWQQQQNSAALHSTRIRASSWLNESSLVTDREGAGDASGHLLQVDRRGGGADPLQWPARPAGASVMPYGV
eukprot:jgi/Ulvmu1/12717/UM095_0021.1